MNMMETQIKQEPNYLDLVPKQAFDHLNQQFEHLLQKLEGIYLWALEKYGHENNIPPDLLYLLHGHKPQGRLGQTPITLAPAPPVVFLDNDITNAELEDTEMIQLKHEEIFLDNEIDSKLQIVPIPISNIKKENYQELTENQLNELKIQAFLNKVIKPCYIKLVKLSYEEIRKTPRLMIKSKTSQEIQRYDCDKCDKSFSRKNHFEHHQFYVHAKQKEPYECNYCKKVFGEPLQLEIHRRVHTGEKPYPCKDCELCFSQPSNANLHWDQLHAPESAKRFKCRICGKKFMRESLLKGHEKYHLRTVKPCVKN